METTEFVAMLLQVALGFMGGAATAKMVSMNTERELVRTNVELSAEAKNLTTLLDLTTNVMKDLSVKVDRAKVHLDRTKVHLEAAVAVIQDANDSAVLRAMLRSMPSFYAWQKLAEDSPLAAESEASEASTLRPDIVLHHSPGGAEGALPAKGAISPMLDIDAEIVRLRGVP